MKRAWPVATVTALAVIGCERTNDPISATEVFFNQLAANETRAAFRSSASVFQMQQSEREFAATAQDWGLIGANSVRLESPQFGRRAAKVPIEITSLNQPVLRFIIALSRESGAWRVSAVRTPVNLETGLSANPFTPIGKGAELDRLAEGPMPDQRALAAMTRETLLQFHDAIHQRSFEDFYNNVSRVWQEQLTLGMLTRTFQSFIDQQPSLIGIRELEMNLDPPPRIDSQGLLIVSGSYPAKPLRVVFSLTYHYDPPDWRVFGLQVNLYE